MSMENAWIKLHLQSLDNPIFSQDPTAWHIFETCLMKAYPTGTFTVGRFQLAEISGVKPITAYKALERLRKREMVNTSSNNKRTVVTICNWDKYQSVGNNDVNNKVTTKEQQSNTIKELRTKNKEKELTPLPPFAKLESLGDAEVAWVAAQYSVREKSVRSELESLRLYCESTGKSYRNYRSALASWVRRKVEEGKIPKAAGPVQPPDPEPVERPTPEAMERLRARRRELMERTAMGRPDAPAYAQDAEFGRFAAEKVPDIARTESTSEMPLESSAAA
jgi:DNA-binding transcriptional regulator YhcF (GntR family)